MATKAKIGVLGRLRLYWLRTGAHAAAPPARGDRAAHRRAQRPARRCARCFRSSRRSICRRWLRSTASTGPRRGLDLVFCALPHATTQKVMRSCWPRRRRPRWSISPPISGCTTRRLTPNGTATSIMRRNCRRRRSTGSCEIHRRESRQARLVANPGCYTSCAQLPLIPLIKAKAIDLDEIVVDAKSGMTGAGGRPRRPCCSRKCRKASTPMASATTGTWPSSTRNSRSLPGAR